MSLAEFEAIDRDAATSPADPIALEARAHLRAQSNWDALPVLHDCQRALESRVLNGEFAGADFEALAREQIEGDQNAESFGERRLARALAVAFFARALQERASDADLWRQSARARIALDDRAGAQADFARAREISGETPDDWRAQARDFAEAGQVRAAAWANSRALSLEMPEKLSGKSLKDWLKARKTSARTDEDKLITLELACEWAPADTALLLQRARILRRLNLNDDALADFASAIALKPDRPRIYEERADHFAAKSYSYRANYHALAVADYRRALELRLAAGNIEDDGESLKSVGDTAATSGAWIRAFACYSAALERHGASSALFYARGQTYRVTREIIGSYAMPEYDAAFEDYLRAVKCGAAGEKSFDKSLLMVAAYLARRARRPSAHEQLEALLEARELLRARGVAAALTGAIIEAVAQELRPQSGE